MWIAGLTSHKWKLFADSADGRWTGLLPVHCAWYSQQLKTLEDRVCSLPHIWDTLTLVSHHGFQVWTVNNACISSDGESDLHCSAQCKATISLECRNCRIQGGNKKYHRSSKEMQMCCRNTRQSFMRTTWWSSSGSLSRSLQVLGGSSCPSSWYLNAT